MVVFLLHRSSFCIRKLNITNNYSIVLVSNKVRAINFD